MTQLYDQEAEQVLLGSLVHSAELFHEISEFVKPKDFFFEPHQIIFAAISEEIDRQSQIDLLLIISKLKESNQLEKVGNRSFLVKLAELNSPISAVKYAQKIKDYSLRRRFATSLKEIEKTIGDTQIEINQVLFETEKAVSQVADGTSGDTVIHLRDIKAEFAEYIKELQTSEDGVTGLKTHFEKFDEITSGLKPGQLLVLAARPGVGKTTFALNLAQNVALKSKKPLVFFSLEMSRIELLERMICAEAFIDTHEFKKGRFTERQGQKISRALNRIMSSDFYLDDSPSLSTHDMKFRIRQLGNKLKRENKQLGMVFIDYLQLMTDPLGQKQGRQQEVSNISREMKLIAKEMGVPVMALSQMNRSIEQRGKDPRPQLSDLRESGAIEQDADMVLFIHREDVLSQDVEESRKNIAEIILAKHRAGPTGSFELFFKKENNLFIDRTFQDSEQPGPSAMG